MLDLFDIADKLENEEKFEVVYRIPVRRRRGGVQIETRQGKLLDVAEDSGLLYVSHRGEIVWIKVDEVEELIPV